MAYKIILKEGIVINDIDIEHYSIKDDCFLFYSAIKDKPLYIVPKENLLYVDII